LTNRSVLPEVVEKNAASATTAHAVSETKMSSGFFM